jgi:leucyl-tRNA synthetase
MVLHVTYKDSNGKWLYPDEVIKKDARFIHKDTGLDVIQGRVEKMSKSKNNVVDLEAMLENYGSDAIRLFILSDSPPEKDLEWSASGIDGSSRFILRLQTMLEEINSKPQTSNQVNKKLQSLIHATIKHVTEDIPTFKLNKAIARSRELFNALSDEAATSAPDLQSIKEGFSILIRLLNPFVPHVTEELWQRLGNRKKLYQTDWPSFDEALLQEEEYTIAIQINGRLRATYKFNINISEEEIKSVALELPEVKKHIAGLAVKKIIIVPRKIINIVV